MKKKVNTKVWVVKDCYTGAPLALFFIRHGADAHERAISRMGYKSKIVRCKLTEV